MKELLSLLIKEEDKLIEKTEFIKQSLKSLPKGTLNIKKGAYLQFRHRYYEKGILKEDYIKKDDLEMAKLLAQKSYFERNLDPLEKRLRIIQKLRENLEKDSFHIIYDKLNEIRKSLVAPLFPTYEMRLIEWLEKPYTKIDFYFDNEISTNTGEKVKSKSHKILADLFTDYGIKFKYGCPLKLGDKKIMADFTFLSPNNFEEIYWEHFEFMEEPRQVIDSYKKIELYQAHGIMLGKNLIVSFESSNKFMNLEIIKRQIELYLI